MFAVFMKLAHWLDEVENGVLNISKSFRSEAFLWLQCVKFIIIEHFYFKNW